MQRVSLERNSVSRVDPASICLGQMIAQAAKKARSSISTWVGSQASKTVFLGGITLSALQAGARLNSLSHRGLWLLVTGDGSTLRLSAPEGQAFVDAPVVMRRSAQPRQQLLEARFFPSSGIRSAEGSASQVSQGLCEGATLGVPSLPRSCSLCNRLHSCP